MPEPGHEEVVLDFAAKRKSNIVLKLPEGTFPIPRDPTVGDMGAMFQIEHELKVLLPEYLNLELDLDDDESTGKAVELMNRAQAVIQRLIRLLTPDAPDVRMTPNEITDFIIAYLGQTATAAVLEAISADVVEGAQGPDGGEGGAAGGGETAAPLAPSKRSRKSSSSSGKRSTGRRSGGGKSAGRRSSSTARTSEPEPEPAAV